MTRRSSGLLQVYDRAQVEINWEDASRIGLTRFPTSESPMIRITSRRGSIKAEAWITDRVPPGMVFANFHFPESSANELTLAALDPVAKIPEFKVCAVKVEMV